ncbi:SAM-dependent methyltransferase [Bdellovibrio sp. qaytius]|nr:SAM-dependent methyltransferase [Bdellovibrio sp. qaytius]
MNEVIKHVSDTSFWVAHYRTLESERGDAIFKDPYAKILVGDRASQIDTLKSQTTRWTRFTVVMRTYIIDQMIQELIAKGVTTFINIGAGLDSRPYRMNLGPHIQWIEVDFSHVIDHKVKALKDFTPTCKLESISLDLSNRKLRFELFAELAEKYSNIAVLTEGVLPYLTEEQVSELSEDLLNLKSFKYWIGEYFSEKTYTYLRDPKRMKVLQNAPFQFFPTQWKNFFESRGWRLNQAIYFADVAEKLGRPTPTPKFFKVLAWVMGKKWAEPLKRMSGFLLWERN